MKTLSSDLKVSFYLKKNVFHNGLCPVMGRITIGKSMVQFSCKLDGDPSLWDARAGRINGKSDHARSANREIDKVNVAINARYKEIVSLKGKATAEEVKNTFQGIASAQETLLIMFREHNEEYYKRIGINRKLRTWQNYDIACMHLERFIRHKYNVSDVPFKQLNFAFIEHYDFYLRIECRQMPNTVLRQMIALRKMVKTAIGQGIINRDPFAGYTPERPKTSQKYLPKEELEKLMNTTFDHPNRNFVRDMFAFACYTGLAYADLFNLSPNQIVKADDGSLWLKINRQKTGSVSNIPLLDVPLQIIEKYRGLAEAGKVFPMLSCGKVNLHLKKMAKQCGIDRRLNFHMSRHNFGTETCLSQGVPIETVSRMMGHQSVRTTQIYAKITNAKIDQDMKALSERTKGKYKLAGVEDAISSEPIHQKLKVKNQKSVK